MEFIASRSTIQTWLDNILAQMDEKALTATQAELTVLAASYIKGVAKAARRHAEDLFAKHQAEGLPLEDLDLRVARYVDFKIEMVDAGGADYVLYGQLPKETPAPGYWGLASDWLDALQSDSIIDTIKFFKRLPINPRAIPPPEPGTNRMTLDFTGRRMSVQLESAKQTQLQLPSGS
jgi:hypothetical protein